MNTFVVIGLGRFGTAVATELSAQGQEVLALDMAEEKVQQVAEILTHAVVADARDPAVLKALGIRNYDCAVVAIGGDVGSSALITLNLKELGMKKVVCKAKSHVHRKLLEKIGADRVVFPENEMGIKLAQGLAASNILNFIELSDDYSIVELPVPRSWAGKTLRELNIRTARKVNVIAIRKAGREDELDAAPGGDSLMAAGDVLVALGRSEDVAKLDEVK
jgi:trk system potassium uptake protein TrkA